MRSSIGMQKVVQVTQPFLPPIEEYFNLIETIWNNHWLTNQGPLHEKLKEELKVFFRAKNLTLFSNGHMALETAIQSLGLKGEVITTPFTFPSTTHAIVRSGLKPVFCDIKPDNYNLDETKLEDLITSDTSAIVPVHVYGSPCDVYKINKIAQKHHLRVIYDAAHAFGVEINGRPISHFGDISMFSFHATKVFHTIEGGALVYRNSKLSNLLDQYKNFGISPQDGISIEIPGFNAKMSEFQAAMGLLNLRYFDDAISKRQQIFKMYSEGLKNLKGIKTSNRDGKIKYNYAYYPVYCGTEYPLTRDEIFCRLAEKGIFSRKYFSPLVTDFECYKERYNSHDTPIAKDVTEKILCLPIHGNLEKSEVNRIIRILKNP